MKACRTCHIHGLTGWARHECPCGFLACSDHWGNHESFHPDYKHEILLYPEDLRLLQSPGLLSFINRKIAEELGERQKLQQPILKAIKQIEQKYDEELGNIREIGKSTEIIRKRRKKLAKFYIQNRELENAYSIRIQAVNINIQKTKEKLLEIKTYKLIERNSEIILFKNLSKLLMNNTFTKENIEQCLEDLLEKDINKVVEYPTWAYSLYNQDEEKMSEISQDEEIYVSFPPVPQANTNLVLSSSPELVCEKRDHTGAISAIAVSSCKQFIATGSLKKDIIVWAWDQTELTIRNKRVGHDREINSLHFSLLSDLLVSSSSDETAKVWSLDNFECVLTYNGHFSELYTARFSPNSEFVVSGGRLTNIHIWSSRDGQKLYELDEQMVKKAEFTNDGRYIVSLSQNKNIHVWDIESAKILRTLDHNNEGITAVCLRNDLLVSAVKNQRIRLWNIHTEEILRAIDFRIYHRDILISLDLSECGNYLVSTGYDDLIYIQNLSTGEISKSIEGFGMPHALFLGDNIVTGDSKGKIRILRLTN